MTTDTINWDAINAHLKAGGDFTVWGNQFVQTVDITANDKDSREVATAEDCGHLYEALEVIGHELEKVQAALAAHAQMKDVTK